MDSERLGSLRVAFKWVAASILQMVCGVVPFAAAQEISVESQATTLTDEQVEVIGGHWGIHRASGADVSATPKYL
ncbi:MAG: hypothetical protein RL069_1516, partial [Planctomycetota bacterium]